MPPINDAPDDVAEPFGSRDVQTWMNKGATTKARVQRTDRRIARKAGRHRADPLVQTLGAISEVGDQPPLRAIGTAIVITGLVTGRRALALAGVRSLAAHSLATIIKSAIKHRVDRTRPHHWLNGGDYKARPGKSGDPALNSFPSGHTAGAIAMAAALGRDFPRLALPLNGAAAAIAAVQLPRGKHHLSDIMAGAVIGGAAEWLVNRLFGRVQAAIATGLRGSDRPTPAPPGAVLSGSDLPRQIPDPATLTTPVQ